MFDKIGYFLYGAYPPVRALIGAGDENKFGHKPLFEISEQRMVAHGRLGQKLLIAGKKEGDRMSGAVAGDEMHHIR